MYRMMAAIVIRGVDLVEVASEVEEAVAGDAVVLIIINTSQKITISK